MGRNRRLIAPTAVHGLSFVEGLDNAEDLVHVPQTEWIIASGMAEGAEGAGLRGHMYLVNRANRSSRVLIPGHVAYGPKAAIYGDCPGKPDESKFSSHGLSLSGQTPGEQRLLVHHGERESIEVFRFKAAAPAPALTWRHEAGHLKSAESTARPFAICLVRRIDD